MTTSVTRAAGCLLALVVATAPAAVAQTKAPAKAAAKVEDHESKVTRKDVPAPVLAAFEKAYPKATVKSYSREVEEGKTFYEIESIEGKTTRDVLIAPDGKIAEVEEGLEFTELPQPVQTAFQKKYPGIKPDKAEKLTKGSAIGYEIHFKQNSKSAEAQFDARGKEVKM